MLTTLIALLPVMLITALGYILAKTHIIREELWPGIERLAYFVLFPAILFKSISTADFSAMPTLPMSMALLSTIAVMVSTMLLLRPLFEKHFAIPAKRFTSIFQGSVRWNGILALALADSLIGTEGVALLAVAMAVMIPVLNICSILVLSWYGDSAQDPSPAKLAKDLYTNPFLLSIGAALLVNFSGLPLPGFFLTTLTALGAAALPVGIICVGASLDLNSLRRPGPALTSGTFIRLLINPMVGAGFAILFGITGAAYTAILIACSVPAASNAYLLSRLMGGDAKLMAEILTMQTVFAAATIPLVLIVLG